jgi:hypothetical protein
LEMKMWMQNRIVNQHQTSVPRTICKISYKNTVHYSWYWVCILSLKAHNNCSFHKSRIPVFDWKNTENKGKNYASKYSNTTCWHRTPQFFQV